MASPPIVEDADLAARRAKTRIGVAVVLLAIALGGLTLLSRNNKTHTEPAESPVPSEKQESVASPAPQGPAQISSEQQEPPPPPAATPETPAAPTAETPAEPPPPPPPAPVVSKLPPEPSHTAAPVTPRSVTADSPKALAEEKAEKPAPAKPAQPQAEPAPAKQASATPEKPVPVAAKPTKAEPKSYEVQVGVFTDMDNAKQLQAKLAEHGIPSHTETKLQIGPFASKAEADAAQVKLKALGMGAVIVPGK